jgi:hypothetical protein
MHAWRHLRPKTVSIKETDDCWRNQITKTTRLRYLVKTTEKINWPGQTKRYTEEKNYEEE